ncbi:MAG: class I poly(R)-hydroxyalkanoic acid synthase [Rhizobiales bacterium PAR1]|nr:MAG: class I poly(R)-hydroxyalkanoic acid synthase [Rhizobiales bacterium PAR1]
MSKRKDKASATGATKGKDLTKNKDLVKKSEPGKKAVKTLDKAAKSPVAPAPAPVKPAPVTSEVPKAAPKPAAPAAEARKPEPAPHAEGLAAIPMPDVEKLTAVSTEILTESGKAGAAMLKAMETGEKASLVQDESADMAKTFGAVAEYWVKDPARFVSAQKDISLDLINLWSSAIKQVGGEKPEPVAPMPARDPRFADAEWNDNPYFNFLKQAYFIGQHWAQDLVDRAEGLDEHTKRKASFYVRQLAGALSPSNFVMTNPELLRATVEEQGENIARGMKMLAEDVEAGKGELKIRQTDNTKFEVGVNLAITPGKVVFRNELFELIQYTPSTPEVYKTPLLIVPPWINKFYILDLNPEKSFIRWAVSQGQTVFVIAWINPDSRHRTYDFEAYMKKGILTAIEQIEVATGEKSVNTIGYCVGGTLLAVTLAYIAQGKRPERIKSATFFTTQVDFTYAGDLLTFVDENQIKGVEELMAKFGYLPGEKMAGAFNMLRPNDLIWSYMVNNYLKGKKPAPFDLLFWNSDSTRMAEANHSFYLRNCYLNNTLSQGRMVVGDRTLDLSKVKIPVYNLAAKEDHIAPAKSVFVGSKFFGGPVTYVMAGSGHIAGVVNPVAKPKYQFWTGGPVAGEFEDWVKSTTEHPGTWWPHWMEWLTKGDKLVPAREPGGGKLKPLCDAPGTYVKIKS